MQVTKEITKIENSAVRLTATVAKEDVAKSYAAGMARYARTIQLPGFRKGHVPVHILEQKYGAALRSEITGDLIDQALNEILQGDDAKDFRPLPYAQPRLEGDSLPELDTASDLTFTVTYDVFPQVEVKNLDGITIREPQVEIGQTELDNELKALQERNATVLDKKEDEPVEAGNIVTIDYRELDESGATIGQSEREGFVFTVGTGENIYKIDDDIVGMKKDETRQLTKTYAGDDPDKELAGKTKRISVTVRAIKVRELPELDDDLAQDVSEKYKTLDDLKQAIMRSMNTARTRKLAEVKSQSLLEQLVEKNPFDLPRSMVQAEQDSRWSMMAQQFQTTPEDLERMVLSSGQSREEMLAQWTGDSEKMLKSRIIVDALIRERNITVTPEEVEARYAQLAAEQGVTEDEVREHYKDAKAREYLVDETKENKLYDELYGQVRVEPGDKMTFAELLGGKS